MIIRSVEIETKLFLGVVREWLIKSLGGWQRLGLRLDNLPVVIFSCH